MNSDYLNSLPCSSAVRISTRIISTPLSFKSIFISIRQTCTPLSWSLTPTSPTLLQVRCYDYSNVMTTPTLQQVRRYDKSDIMTIPMLWPLRLYDKSDIMTSPTLWLFQCYDHSDFMTSPTLWLFRLSPSSVTYSLPPDFTTPSQNRDEERLRGHST